MYNSLNLGVNSSERQYKYMVTIRKFQTKHKVVMTDIHTVLDYIIKKYPSLRFMQTVYEVDPTYQQLHAHSIVFLHQQIKFASISRCGDFRIYWRPIFDLKGARSYLTKVVKSQKIQQNILLHNLISCSKTRSKK